MANKYCTECGHKTNILHKFCPSCGHGKQATPKASPAFVDQNITSKKIRFASDLRGKTVSDVNLDQDDSTDIEEVPHLDKLSVSIEKDKFFGYDAKRINIKDLI